MFDKKEVDDLNLLFKSIKKKNLIIGSFHFCLLCEITLKQTGKFLETSDCRNLYLFLLVHDFLMLMC